MADNSSSVNSGYRMRKKWLTVLILFLGVIPFVAMSVIPLVQTIATNPQTNKPSPTPTATTAAKPDSQLKDQEKGYLAVLQREPNNPTALEGLVQTRLQMIQAGQGEIKSVIEPLEKLAKLQPDRTDYLVLLAQAQQYVGNREAAIQAFQNVLATKPGDIKALQGMVSLYLQEQRPEAAIALLQETLEQKAAKANKIQPGSVDVPSVQLLLGSVYTAQRRYDEAIALFDQLAKDNKNDFRPVLAKAQVLMDQGKTKEAQPLFKAAAALAPAQFKDQINQMALKTQSPQASNPEPGKSIPGQSAAPAPAASPKPN